MAEEKARSSGGEIGGEIGVEARSSGGEIERRGAAIDEQRGAAIDERHGAAIDDRRGAIVGLELRLWSPAKSLLPLPL